MFVSGAFHFHEICRKIREPTSGLEPLTPAPATSDHSGVAGGCKCRIFRRLSLLRVAPYRVPGGIGVVSKGRQSIDGPNPSMTLEMRLAMQSIRRLADLDVETIVYMRRSAGSLRSGSGLCSRPTPCYSRLKALPFRR